MKKQFSPELVRIPNELNFLTDFIQTAHYSSNLVIGTHNKSTKTVTDSTGKVKSTVSVWNPRFVLSNRSGFLTATGSETTSVDLASAFIEYEVAPVITVEGSSIKVLNDTYIKVGDSLTKIYNGQPKNFDVTINVGSSLKNKTLQEIIDYFGNDFIISEVTTPGTSFFNVDVVNKSTVMTDICQLKGKVTIARVLADCIASNIYDKKGKFLAGPYPFLKQTSTIDDLPKFTTTTTYKKGEVNQLTSLFVYLQVENGKLINNTFVNKSLYNEVTYPIKNPAGYNFTPSYIIKLQNEPKIPYQVEVGGSKVGMGDTNGWLQVRSFDEMDIVELTDLTKDGYIDVDNKTLYINPSKKCVFRVEFTQANLGDPFAKTYGYEGAINYQTGKWSKFHYTL
jgi:hypothetical protein